MDSPLRQLREWLCADRGAAAPANVGLRRRFDGLATATPLALAAALGERLPGLIGEQQSLAARLSLLEAALREVQQLLPALEADVERCLLPLQGDHFQAALTADNLLKLLAAGYDSLLAKAEPAKLDGETARLVNLALLRATQAHGRRHLLAARARLAPSESSWRKLHRFHLLAMSHGLAEREVAGSSVAGAYVAALMLAWAGPGRFARHDLDGLRDETERLSRLARIVHAGTPAAPARNAALLLVEPASGRPGRPLLRPQRERFGGDALIVDASAIVAQLHDEIAVARRAVSRSGAAEDAPLRIRQTLLAALRGPPTRRFGRSSFHRRVTIVCGAEDLCRFLGGPAFRRRRGEAAAWQPAIAVSQWSLVEESPDGFGVRFLTGDAPPIAVGELLGLRLQDRSPVHVCLVRRVSDGGPAGCELGLQELAPEAVAVELPGHGAGTPRCAILMPSLPAFLTPGIAAAPGHLHAGMQISFQPGERPIRLRVSSCVETTGHCHIHLLDPVDRP